MIFNSIMVFIKPLLCKTIKGVLFSVYLFSATP